MSFPSFVELSRFPNDLYVETVRKLFETAKPLEDHLIANRNKYKSYDDIIDSAQKFIQELFVEQKDKVKDEKRIENLLQVINCHPRLGETDAKKLSEQSKKEQQFGSTEDEEILKQFLNLSHSYENKFGFKFIVFVNGRNKKQLIPIVEERMNNNKNQEMQTAVDSMIQIARDRLKKFSQSNL